MSAQGPVCARAIPCLRVLLGLSFLLHSIFSHAADGDFKPVTPAEIQQNALPLEKVKEHATKLAAFGTRLPGTTGYTEAREYLVKQLTQMGYAPPYTQTASTTDSNPANIPALPPLTVGTQKFWGITPVDRGDGTLSVATPGGKKSFPLYAVWPNGVTVSRTPAAGLSGPLIYVKNGRTYDFDKREINNSLVVMELSAESQWTFAAGLGAQSVIFIEPESAQRPDLERLFLASPAEFPRFWIPRKEGLELKALLEAGTATPVMGTAVVTSEWKNALWENLVVLIPGEKAPADDPNKDATIILAAYYDSNSVIPALAPGAEQALSCGALLELARQFKTRPPPRDVLLLFCGGHFQGLKAEREFFAAAADPEKVNEPLSDVELLRFLYQTRIQSALLPALLKDPTVLTDRSKVNTITQEVAKEFPDSDPLMKEMAERVALEMPQVSKAAVVFALFFWVMAFVWWFRHWVLRGVGLPACLVIGLGCLLYGVLLPIVLQKQAHEDLGSNMGQRRDELLRKWKDRLADISTDGERSLRLLRQEDLTGKIKDDPAYKKIEHGQIEYEKTLQLLFAISEKGMPDSIPDKPELLIPRLQEPVDALKRQLTQEIEWATLERARRWENTPVTSLLRERVAAASKRPLAFYSLDLSAGHPGVGQFFKGAQYPLGTEIESRYKIAGRVLMKIAESVEKAAGCDQVGELLPDTLKGKRSYNTFTPTPLALAAEAAVQFQVRGLTLATPYDRRLYWDSPQDLPDRAGLNWKFVDSQLQLTGVYLRRIMSESALFEKSRFDDNPVMTGFCQAGYRLVRAGGSKSIFPDVDVAGAIVNTVPDDNAPITAAGVRLIWREMTNSAGRARFNGAIRNRPLRLEFYACDPDNGEIIFTLNKAKHALKENQTFQTYVREGTKVDTCELFRAQGLAMLDLVDPGRLIGLGGAALLAGQTESRPLEFGTSHYFRTEPHRVLFADPGSRVKYLFREGEFGIRLALLGVDDKTTESLLDPKQVRGVNERAARGRGIVLGVRKIVDWAPMRTASDMWSLSEKRLDELRAHNIGNSKLDNPDYEKTHEKPGLHNLSKDRLIEARKARTEGRYADAWRLSTEAWGLESRSYPEVLGTANDAVLGVVFYLFLLLPFCFFSERLVFGFPKVEHQIQGFFGIFIALFGILMYVHPAFDLMSAPWIILLAFIILVLTGLVVVIVYSKFESEMKLMQQGVVGVQSADVNRASAAMVAVSLGISQMRRRKFRTFLTCATVVLLTFTALSFTSTVKSISAASIDLSPGDEKDGQYNGILLRQLNWDALRPEVHPRFQAEVSAFDESLYGTPRYALVSTAKTGSGLYVDLFANGQQSSPAGLLGLSPREKEIFPKLAKEMLLAGRWLEESDTNVCLLPWERVQQLKPVEMDAKDWTPEKALGMDMRLFSSPVKLIGIFDSNVFMDLKDLDQESLAPVDFASSENQGQGSGGGQSASVENLEGASSQHFTHVSAAETVIVPWQLAQLMGANLYSVAVRVDDPKNPKQLDALVERLLKRVEKNLFVGQDNRRKLFASTGKMSLAGLGNLFVPLLIAVLILLNTMIGAVFERKREITIFSALGLAPSHIASLFMAEALVYATLGAILGYLLGQGTSKFMQLYGETLGIGGLYLNYSSSSAVFVTLIVMLAVLGSTLYPAYQASQAASPSEDRRWSVPAPRGDEIALELPFSFQRDLVPGVALFLHEYFDGHSESSLGKFTAREVTLEAFHTPQGEGICLFFMAWLTPYDLGVSQEVQIYIVPVGEGLYVTECSFFRVSGYVDSWQRVNLPFLNALRKHFLVWRTYSPEQRQEYAVRGFFTFQEAFDAVGWPPPEGAEEPEDAVFPELDEEGRVIGGLPGTYQPDDPEPSVAGASGAASSESSREILDDEKKA